MTQPWMIEELQKIQLSPNNTLGLFEPGLGANSGWLSGSVLAELNHSEGDRIPFAVRMGPNADPDPGSRKKYRALEIDGDGQGYLLVWVDRRLVSQGFLSAQESPGALRRLNIPRGLGTGYGLDFLLLWQGTLLAVEVFWDPMTDTGEPG